MITQEQKIAATVAVAQEAVDQIRRDQLSEKAAIDVLRSAQVAIMEIGRISTQ